MSITLRLGVALSLVALVATGAVAWVLRLAAAAAVEAELAHHDLVAGDVAEGVLAATDVAIALSALLAVAFAWVVAYLVGRSIERPIEALAAEAREVVRGEPRPVRVGGGREMQELATAFNHAIDELTRMRKRLAATERIAARREIARRVAHEIKNPLAPIRAAVETLRRLWDRDDERFDEYFDEASRTVLEEVHRIATIVTEFTRFSRLPAPTPEPLDLVAVARSIVTLHAADPEMIRTARRDEPPRVELIAKDVPEVHADRDQIVQVLTNLVQNGLEAASAVRDDPRVVVRIEPQGESHVRVVVRDNGPGVPEEIEARLFEPYATSKSDGTGLGLAIVQRIVFEHGGEISYRPATHGGAVFAITLPVAGPSVLDKAPELDVTGAPRSG